MVAVHVPQWNGLTFTIINFQQPSSKGLAELLDPTLSRTYHAVEFNGYLVIDLEMSTTIKRSELNSMEFVDESG